MEKLYKISQVTSVTDEQRTITITTSETKEVITVRKVSVAELRVRHARILDNIEGLKAEADTIINELVAIDASLEEITISNIPSKITQIVAK